MKLSKKRLDLCPKPISFSLPKPPKGSFGLSGYHTKERLLHNLREKIKYYSSLCSNIHQRSQSHSASNFDEILKNQLSKYKIKPKRNANIESPEILNQHRRVKSNFTIKFRTIKAYQGLSLAKQMKSNTSLIKL